VQRSVNARFRIVFAIETLIRKTAFNLGRVRVRIPIIIIYRGTSL
jgi:hypothetical protein